MLRAFVTAESVTEDRNVSKTRWTRGLRVTCVFNADRKNLSRLHLSLAGFHEPRLRRRISYKTFESDTGSVHSAGVCQGKQREEVVFSWDSVNASWSTDLKFCYFSYSSFTFCPKLGLMTSNSRKCKRYKIFNYRSLHGPSFNFSSIRTMGAIFWFVFI